MKEISTAELKKAIVAVETERLKHPATFRPDRAQRAALQKSRKESEKAVSAFLRKAGLDLKGFQALQERRSAELERMVAKHKADAIKLAASRKGTLYSSIAAQSPSSFGRSRSPTSRIPPPCRSAVLRNSNSRLRRRSPRRWASTSIGPIPTRTMR